MRPRILSLVLVLPLVFAAVTAHAQKRRAVRTPAADCSYTVSTTFADPIPDGGMIRGRVNVATLTAGNCGGWAVDTNADWVTIEAEPFASTPAAYVTVTPNNGDQPRTATVRIASATLTLTQLGRSAPPEVNLLTNGKFHTGLSGWGWQDRFPNGTGDVSWSSLDAGGSMTSGSMRLRDDLTSGPAYQQMACANLAPGTYDYGFSARVANRDAARAVIAFVPFEGPNCTGAYPQPYPVQTVRPSQNNVWQSYTFTDTLPAGHQSLGIVVAGWARQAGLQEVWVDDVFLRNR
jgi:hypothetical protein